MAIVERDPETGRVTKGSLTSAEGRALAKHAANKTDAIRETEALAIASELGYSERECPPSIRLLANQAASGGSRGLSAIKAILAMRGVRTTGTPGPAIWDGKGDCPTCKGRLVTVNFSDEVAVRVAEILRDNQNKQEQINSEPMS